MFQPMGYLAVRGAILDEMRVLFSQTLLAESGPVFDMYQQRLIGQMNLASLLLHPTDYKKLRIEMEKVLPLDLPGVIGADIYYASEQPSSPSGRIYQ